MSPESVYAMPRSVTCSVPISPIRGLRKIGGVLSSMPAEHAGIGESWLASVDTLIRLKADEAENGYLPFVCRLGFLLGRTGGLGDGAGGDKSELALTNVLQYVTGSRSRPLADGVLDAAREVLRDIREEVESSASPTLTDGEKKAIDNLAFEHKSVLIQDKTLPDTVQPSREWSLKAAKKLQGCACCGPEDEDDEEEDGNWDGGRMKGGAEIGGGTIEGSGAKRDMSVPGAVGLGISQRRVDSSKCDFVDGTKAFAFDPTKFS